jgi:hypothetical protein
MVMMEIEDYGDDGEWKLLHASAVFCGTTAKVVTLITYLHGNIIHYQPEIWTFDLMEEICVEVPP